MDHRSAELKASERGIPVQAETAPVGVRPGLRQDPPSEEADSSIPLDQWRGLALIMVLISHGLYYTGRVAGIGRVGVNLFFFISGILVFRSLDRSSAKDPWKRARSFWKRRFIRLYPALVGYLVLMVPIVYFCQNLGKHVPGYTFHDYVSHLPNALGYVVNYTPPPCHPGLNHLWSLATELQFYLLGPLIFALGGSSISRRRWVWGGLLSVFLALGAVQPLLGDRAKYHFEFSVWPMMLGFVAEWMKPRFVHFFRFFSKPILWASVGVMIASVLLMQAGPKAKIVVVALGAYMVLPCYCAYVAGVPMHGVFGKVMTWLGQRTYSIYLWQQPLTLCGYLPTALHSLGAALSCGVGAVAFHWFERPFLSRKRTPSAAAPVASAEVCQPAKTTVAS